VVRSKKRLQSGALHVCQQWWVCWLSDGTQMASNILVREQILSETWPVKAECNMVIFPKWKVKGSYELLIIICAPVNLSLFHPSTHLAVGTRKWNTNPPVLCQHRAILTDVRSRTDLSTDHGTPFKVNIVILNRLLSNECPER